MGMLQMRDQLFLSSFGGREKQDKRDLFDAKFKPMFEAAQATRDAAVEAIRLIAPHVTRIRNGQAVRFRANQYDILETIDTKLSQAVDKLINQAVVSTKSGLQDILRSVLALDIGFLFQQDCGFNQGVAQLEASGQNQLARYLEDVRASWLSHLQDLRNRQEHQGWTLDAIDYHRIGPAEVEAVLPQIDGIPVDQFARQTANRVLLFIENMMVFSMARNCKFPIFAAEIPREQRNHANSQRFRLVPRGLDQGPPWTIGYRDDIEFV